MMNGPRFWTYLVGWDDELVIKAGITMDARRWRTFVNRGARLYQLHGLVDYRHDFGFYLLEQEIHAHLRATLSRAFVTRDEAASLLSNRGGGWLECHRADTKDAYLDALASCIRIMQSHGTGHCGTDMHALMHGRTDARTNEDPHSPTATNSQVRNAHAHIRQMAVEKVGEK